MNSALSLAVGLRSAQVKIKTALEGTLLREEKGGKIIPVLAEDGTPKVKSGDPKSPKETGIIRSWLEFILIKDVNFTSEEVKGPLDFAIANLYRHANGALPVQSYEDLHKALVTLQSSVGFKRRELYRRELQPRGEWGDGSFKIHHQTLEQVAAAEAEVLELAEALNRRLDEQGSNEPRVSVQKTLSRKALAGLKRELINRLAEAKQYKAPTLGEKFGDLLAQVSPKVDEDARAAAEEAELDRKIEARRREFEKRRAEEEKAAKKRAAQERLEAKRQELAALEAQLAAKPEAEEKKPAKKAAKKPKSAKKAAKPDTGGGAAVVALPVAGKAS